jgi:hypothetical protein
LHRTLIFTARLDPRLRNLRGFARMACVNTMAGNDNRMKPVAGAAFQFLNQLL